METKQKLTQPGAKEGENPIVTNRENTLVHIKRRITGIYDWVVGPASTDKDRTDRMVAEALDRKPEYLEPLGR